MKYLISRSRGNFFIHTFSLIIYILGTIQVSSLAQDTHSDAQMHQTATQWSGISFTVLEIRHILQNRLLVIIDIEGDRSVPDKGIFLGIAPVIPPNTKPLDMFLYDAKPFSIMGATMTDEQTHVTYPSLPPVAPPNMAYFPSATLHTFFAGTRDILSLQFDCPPPPPPPPLGQVAISQTLSFLLPKAKGPIAHVPLPPVIAGGANSP